MKFETDTDEMFVIGIIIILITFLLGVVGPCISKYGMEGKPPHAQS